MATRKDNVSLNGIPLASVSMDIVKLKGIDDIIISTNILDHDGTVTTLYFLPLHAVTLWRYVKSIVDKGRWRAVQNGSENNDHPISIFIRKKDSIKRDGRPPSPSNLAKDIMVLDVQQGVTITVTFVDQTMVCIAMLDAVTQLFLQLLTHACIHAGINPETAPELPHIDLQ